MIVKFKIHIFNRIDASGI